MRCSVTVAQRSWTIEGCQSAKLKVATDGVLLAKSTRPRPRQNVKVEPFTRQGMRAKSMAKRSVEAPKGFHWMKAGKGYKLMKDPAGGYKPHKGASKKASFEVQKVHKK